MRREGHGFLLVSKHMSITYIDQFFLPMVSYHIFLKHSISVNIKFQKTKTEAPIVIKMFFKKYIYLSMYPSYFHQSDEF